MPSTSSHSPPAPDARRSARALLALCAYTAVAAGGYLYLTLHAQLLRWPFARPASGYDALRNVAAYAPMLALAAASLLFVRAAGAPIAAQYRVVKLDRAAWWLLVASAAYAVLMLRSGSPFARLEYWPPMLLLCAMSAVAEETLYRVSFLTLAERTFDARRAVWLQGIAYALPHLAISLQLAAFALLFGIALGRVRQRSGSVWSALLCHFIVDLGAIGAPFLPDGAPHG